MGFLSFLTQYPDGYQIIRKTHFSKLGLLHAARPDYTLRLIVLWRAFSLKFADFFIKAILTQLGLFNNYNGSHL